MDNTYPQVTVLSSHKQEENGILASPRPALSLDLALSDFFFFGAVKGQLAGDTFESADELVEEIYERTSAIPRANLETIFLEWEERLRRRIDINGAHVG
jgi:hypothetical protein